MPFSAKQAHKVGTEIGIDWDKVEFDSEDLAAGMNVELEHGTKLGDEVNLTNDDPAMTAKIAWAHLMESPDYYDFLAAMEEEMKAGTETERERAGAVRRRAYQIQKTVGPDKKIDKPRLSPELDQYAKQYYKQIEKAVDSGVTAEEAFKQKSPSLESLSSNDLVNLMWENQQLGGRGSLQKFKDLLPALDLFDLMQKVLERAIWETAVYQWSTTRTKKQTQQKQRTPEEQQAAEQRDQEGTKVLQPKQQTAEDSPTKVLPKTGGFTYRGHRYEEM